MAVKISKQLSLPFKCIDLWHCCVCSFKSFESSCICAYYGSVWKLFYIQFTCQQAEHSVFCHFFFCTNEHCGHFAYSYTYFKI